MPSIKDQVRVSYNKDGVDHVNLSAYAETEIGRICSPDWRKKFHMPHMGDFASPKAFANWMVSGGDEELRHNNGFYKTYVPISDYHMLVEVAKFYQLSSLRANLVEDQALVELPWVMYKKHLSGVREFDRWTTYAEEVNAMVKFILAKGARSHYRWDTVSPDHLGCLNFYLKKVTGEAFVKFEELNRLASERNIERSKVDKLKQKSSGYQTPEDGIESAGESTMSNEDIYTQQEVEAETPAQDQTLQTQSTASEPTESAA